MKGLIDRWKNNVLHRDDAEGVIYDAFIKGELDVPKRLGPVVHKQYFEPEYVEFEEPTAWSLSNAFTSAFKALKPIPMFNATTNLSTYLGDKIHD